MAVFHQLEWHLKENTLPRLQNALATDDLDKFGVVCFNVLGSFSVPGGQFVSQSALGRS